MTKTTLATVALPLQWDPDAQLARMLSRLDEAAGQGADLVVFPEQALHGYLTDTLALDFDNVAHQFAAAETVPSGPRVATLIAAAERLGVHLVFGLTERDAHRADVLYNTVVLTGPEGYIGRYRKVHQPGDEKHVYYPGDEFPVFETAIGRIGMLICYDKVFPESTRALALAGAEIMIMPTAWAYEQPGGGEDPAADRMVDYYTLFGRVRALENQCWFVASNAVGSHGRLDYHGHSRVIDPLGTIVADTGSTESIAYATVEVSGAILHARSVGYIAYNFLKDYVPMTPIPSLPPSTARPHLEVRP